MTDEIPQMSTRDAPKGGIPLSLVWIVPLVAVGVALFIAWQTYAQRGPLIAVTFEDATGLVVGQTEVKFRSLTVGLVEELSFGDDLERVVAHIRLEKSIVPYVDDSAQFWIVQPEVSARGVTGLETVLSGSYIQGSWDNDKGTPKTEFTGLESEPLAPSDQEGILITLRSEQGGRVHSGAPIVFRGVTVGEIDEPKLALDGSGVTANAFIRAPYDQLLNTNTRFWGVSGISLDIGASGVNLNVANLASIIQGGATFDTIATGGSPISDGHLFQVYVDKATAEKSLLTEANIEELTYSAVFSGAIGGLSAGASVVFGGVTVGQVTDLGAFISPTSTGASEVNLRVDFVLQPRYLGLENDPEGADLRDFIAAAIEDGLYAQLTNESLISSALLVELVQVSDREPGALDLESGPYPVIPSLPVELADLSASAEGIVDRIAALPIEALMDNAVNVLASANQLLNSPEVQQAPGSAVALMDETRATVAAFDPEPLVADLQATTKDVREIVANLGSQENQDLVTSSLEQLETLLTELQASAAALPDLMASAQSVADQAAALELSKLVDQTTQTIADINTIVADPASQALPSELQALLAEARGIVGSEALQSVPQEVTDAIESLQAIIETVQDSSGLTALLASLERLDDIAASVEAAADGLPELRNQVAAVLTKAEALEIEPLLASATSTANSVEALTSDPATQALPADVQSLLADTRNLVGSDAVQAIPQELADAIASLQNIIDTIQDSSGLTALLASLDRLDEIAASIETTANGLPALQDQVSDVLSKAAALDIETLLASATATVTSVEAIATDPATQALPGEVQGLLTETRTVVGSEAVQTLPDDLATSLARIDRLLAQIEDSNGIDALLTSLNRLDAITASIETTTNGLPELRDQISNVIAKAEDLPIDGIVASTEELLESANAFIGSEDTAAVPASLTAALDEVTGVLTELRAGGTVENVNATLSSAADAAEAIAAAAESLPELTDRLNGLIADAEALMAAYGSRSAFNAQTLSALYDIRAAARAVTDLSRAIERNPSSLIRGR